MAALVTALGLLFGIGACAGSTETAAGPADQPAALESPAIFLDSAAGSQEAVRGSSCISRDDPATGEGQGACVDTAPPRPDRLSVVRPGETVVVRLDQAAVTGQGSAVVYHLGCDEPVAEFALAGRESDLQVSLRQGVYQLDVSAAFEADDGSSGDVSGALGLLVDQDREPGIVSASEASPTSC